jgi:hypothetical protein
MGGRGFAGSPVLLFFPQVRQSRRPTYSQGYISGLEDEKEVIVRGGIEHLAPEVIADRKSS